jgi:hypothetical protein
MSFAVDEIAGTATYAAGRDALFSGALVYVFNRTQGVGVITTAELDGSVAPTMPFAASLSPTPDAILVTYQVGDDLVSACAVLAQGTPTTECDR